MGRPPGNNGKPYDAPHPWGLPTQIDPPVFLAVNWAGWAIAAVCVVLRLVSRFKTFKRLFVDDYFVIVAISFALTGVILLHLHNVIMFDIDYMASGYKWTYPGMVMKANRYFKATMGVMMLFYSTLWCIKFSFLIFFKRLGARVQHQRMLWWPIFGITVVFYIISIGTIPYYCLAPGIGEIIRRCNEPSAIKYIHTSFRMACVWDVISDILIMIIPFHLLWNVQIPLYRKLALAGIFALALLTVITAIVRAVVIDQRKGVPDAPYLYAWTTIETHVSIIMACLGSFQQLFTSQGTRAVPPPFVHPGMRALRGSRAELHNTASKRAHSKYGLSKDSRSNTDNSGSSVEQLFELREVHPKQEPDMVVEKV